MKKILVLLTVLCFVNFWSLAQSKVAHVNSQTLLDTLPSRKKALLEIQDLNTRAEVELTELGAKIEKEYNAYMARRGTQSEQMNQYDESRLQKMQQDAQTREKEISDMLQNMTISMNEKTLKTVKDAVAVIATKKGFNYVIDESTTLFSNGTNITSEVITELLRLDALSSK